MVTPGLHVAMVGMDGIGKSALSQELADLVRRCGHDVRLVSWRRFLEAPGEPVYPREQLEHLWVQSFRVYFGEATLSDGTPVELPVSFDDLNARGGTEYLNGVAMSGLRGTGPLAAAWIELSANTLLHDAVIRPLVQAGCVVIQESYGYKHLIKLFAMASRLSPELAGAARVGAELVGAYFGLRMRPDVGIHVAGDPRLALTWRLGENGRLGTFESLSASGAGAAESFLALQADSEERFARFARAHGWVRIQVRDVDRSRNRAVALRVLSGTALGPYLPAGADG